MLFASVLPTFNFVAVPLAVVNLTCIVIPVSNLSKLAKLTEYEVASPLTVPLQVPYNVEPTG